MKALFSLLMPVLFLSIANAQIPLRTDSVFGSGNTGDLTLQLNFARSTAIAYVRALPAQDLWTHTNDLEVRQLYKECRSTLLEGLLSLSFQVVGRIPDGEGLHAFMQRADGKIRISRHEYERGISRGLVTGPSLVAHLLHEVGHDCVLNGQRLDDSQDSLLDRMGQTVVSAGVNKSLSPYLDYQVIRDVQQNKPVSFESLSAKIREDLTKQILEFAGERLYFANRTTILSRFGERPASAARLERSHPGSRIPTWSEVAVEMSVLDQIFIRHFIEGSLLMKAPTVATHSGGEAIPRQLHCVNASMSSEKGIRCRLSLDLRTLGAAERLQMQKVQMTFTLDIFGEVRIESITGSN